MDAVEAALWAVTADVGEIEGEGAELLGAVRLGDTDVLQAKDSGGGVTEAAALVPPPPRNIVPPQRVGTPVSQARA